MSEQIDLTETSDPVALTSEIVAAYVSHNAVNWTDLTKLIGQVHASLVALRTGSFETAVEFEPAVPVKKSATPDHLVCLEDGKRFKSLKRHLRTEHGLTPEQYRQKWGLASNYPMVARRYSEVRTSLLRDHGFGRKG